MEEGEKARCEETEEERSSENAGGQPGDVQGDAGEKEWRTIQYTSSSYFLSLLLCLVSEN